MERKTLSGVRYILILPLFPNPLTLREDGNKGQLPRKGNVTKEAPTGRPDRVNVEFRVMEPHFQIRTSHLGVRGTNCQRANGLTVENLTTFDFLLPQKKTFPFYTGCPNPAAQLVGFANEEMITTWLNHGPWLKQNA